MNGFAIHLGLALATGIPGAGLAWWLWTERPDPEIRAWALAGMAAASLAVFLFAELKRGGLGWKIGVWGPTAAIAAMSIAIDTAPFLLAFEFGGLLALAGGSAAIDAFRLLAPLLIAPLLGFLWLVALLTALTGAGRIAKRRRSKSELHGASKLMGARHLRKLARRPDGILLGQTGPGSRAPLAVWPLEGHAVTIAPPRTGKGALIAANMLAPDGRGWQGSTVTIDPRGELYPIVARRRRELGRKVILLDPYGVIDRHREQHPHCHLPKEVQRHTYNPLDFLRGEEKAVQDIDVLVQGLLTPPANDAGNSRHFHESAKRLISGHIAWAKYRAGEEKGNLAHVFDNLSAGPDRRRELMATILTHDAFAGGLAHRAMESEMAVSSQESGSNYTTIANQMQFLAHPEIQAQTAASTFDPHDLAKGNMDIFVVVPEEVLKAARPWLRLWIAIPFAVASRRSLKKDMLVVMDEMPAVGYLEPVMDAWRTGAGRGVHFWAFAQALSGIDGSWGKQRRQEMIDLSEVVQILGWARADAAGAEEISKTIGHATFEGYTQTSSGTPMGRSVLLAANKVTTGDSRNLVKERIVRSEDLLMMKPDEQYVIAASKELPRDAMRLNNISYWKHAALRGDADPNPYVERKLKAAGLLRRREGPTAEEVYDADLAEARKRYRAELKRMGLDLDAEEAAAAAA